MSCLVHNHDDDDAFEHEHHNDGDDGNIGHLPLASAQGLDSLTLSLRQQPSSALCLDRT